MTLCLARSALLPAPTLAESINHFRQPFRAVLPINLHPVLGSVTVTLLDGSDDTRVLGNRYAKLIDDRAGVQSPVALGLRLNGIVECKESRTRTGLNNAPVEAQVELEDTIGVTPARLRDATQSVVQRL